MPEVEKPYVYGTFAELEQNEVYGVDYEIEVVDRKTPIAIVAPHGGAIEIASTEIARAIAGEEYSFYSLTGMKPRGNRIMHMSSMRFDEPRAVALVAASEYVLTVHGKKGDEVEDVVVGGLELALCHQLIQSLKQSGFNALTADGYPHLAGVRPTNICNLGSSRVGNQLEISQKLRLRLKVEPELLQQFAAAVRSVLQQRVAQVGE